MTQGSVAVPAPVTLTDTPGSALSASASSSGAGVISDRPGCLRLEPSKHRRPEGPAGGGVPEELGIGGRGTQRAAAASQAEWDHGERRHAGAADKPGVARSAPPAHLRGDARVHSVKGSLDRRGAGIVGEGGRTHLVADGHLNGQVAAGGRGPQVLRRRRKRCDCAAAAAREGVVALERRIAGAGDEPGVGGCARAGYGDLHTRQLVQGSLHARGGRVVSDRAGRLGRAVDRRRDGEGAAAGMIRELDLHERHELNCAAA